MKSLLKYLVRKPSENFHPVLRIILIFLPVALLICSGAYFYYLSQLRFIHEQNQKLEHETVLVGVVSINRSLEYVMQDVHILYLDTDFRRMINDPDEKNIDEVAGDWLAFAEAKKVYNKIRWIDEKGMERLRVNYSDGKGVVVPEKKLQNRSERYFFDDTNVLKEGEVYVSPLDLNIEDDHIQEPYVPTIRFGMPLFNKKGEKKGILLLNYYATSMIGRFQQLTSMRGNSAWLVNQNGFWLKGPVSNDEFGFMFNKNDLSMAHRYPAAWERMKNQEEGQFITAGQTITYILPDTQKWIIANYKETQIENLRPGQEVTITVDAVSDRKFTGKITAISGATGSKYSLVPTDNSAGNFVKIQQRIPVRIDFTDLSKEDNEKLAAGMMVIVKVKL